MPSTTDFAIVAVPVVACLAVFVGLGLVNRPALTGRLALPAVQIGAATSATRTPATVPTTTSQTDTSQADTAQTNVAPTVSVPTAAAGAATVPVPETAAVPDTAPVPTTTATGQAANTAGATPAAAESGATVPEAAATLTRGRELAALLYSQRLTTVWNAFTPAVQREWGTFRQFQAYRAGGLNAFGAEKKVVSEHLRVSGGVRYYTRTARFERGPDHDWTLVLGLNPARQVVAFNIVNTGVLPADSQP